MMGTPAAGVDNCLLPQELLAVKHRARRVATSTYITRLRRVSEATHNDHSGAGASHLGNPAVSTTRCVKLVAGQIGQVCFRYPISQNIHS